jgi:hypothetical protein
VSLATAGSPVPGAGNPHFMILPSTGTAGTGSSLDNSNFNPYMIGPGDFFLTVPGVTSSSNLFDPTTFASLITGVKVGFGTGPDTTPTATYTDHGPPNGPTTTPDGPTTTPDVSAVPAPPSVVLFGLGGFGLALIWAHSRRLVLAA